MESQKRERQDLIQALRARGATWVDVAATLSARYGFNARTAFRLAHGWSQRQAADEWNKRWPDEPKTFKNISYWEQWPAKTGHAPSISVLTRLSRLYQCRVGDLLADVADHRSDDAAHKALSSVGDASLAGANVGRESASDVSSPIVQELAREQPQTDQMIISRAAEQALCFGTWAEATNVGPMTLRRFEMETRRLAREYLFRSPLPVVFDVARLARSAFDLIRNGHQHLNQTRDLYVAAGRLSALLSWMSGDLGNARAAAENARVAWICADQADDPTLRAWAMSVASKTDFWDGNYETAVESARAGQRYGAFGTAHIMLACQEADALKALGRIGEAMDAIARARTLRDGVDTPDDIGGLFSCGEARQANYEIGVQLASGNHQNAIESAAKAEKIYARGAEWAYGTWAQMRFGMASAYIGLSNFAEAEEALDPVLSMPYEKRLDTLSRRAGEVTELLKAPRLGRSSKALQLVDRIHEYRIVRPVLPELSAKEW